MAYSEYTRLRDLEDKESKDIVKKVMDCLESENGSSSVPQICMALNIPPLLVEDIIELLIIKEWLIIPEDNVGDEENE